MKAFLITSSIETKRTKNIELLEKQIDNVYVIEAVYPSIQKVPYLNKLLISSQDFIQRALSHGELGCIMSHRKVWTEIKNDETSEQAFLILESDAIINNADLLKSNIDEFHTQYDIVFWGAFDGRAKLLRSQQKPLGNGYTYGAPLLNSLYCTYGYSINKKAALYLLNNTKKASFPVDYWKYRLTNSGLKIGAIVPELISTEGKQNSYVQNQVEFSIKQYLFDRTIDLKNQILCYFK